MKKQILKVFSLVLVLGLTGCGGGNSSVSTDVSSQADSSSITDVSSQGEESKSSSQDAKSSSQQGEKSSSTAKSSSKVGKTYTVTFDSAGGDDVDPQEVPEGGKATLPEEPTRGGKDFVGWYVGDTDVKWDFNNPVTQDMTLTAKWKLSVSMKLEQTFEPYEVNTVDSEFSVWTNDKAGVVFHENGTWDEGTVHCGWRTMVIFDGEGRLCYGVWCPFNGYGGVASYMYCCNAYYSAKQQGYKNNPAIKLGSNFAENSNDFELVIPKDGFAVTGHGADLGCGAMASMLTGGEWDALGDEEGGYAHGADFNQTHGEWSNRICKFNKKTGKIEAYALATSLTYTGTQAGVAEGNADTGDYTFTVTLLKWNSIKLRYDNGIRASDLDSAKGITITGAYSDGHAATDGLELYTDAADTKTFITASGGIYTFTYNVTAKTLDIQAKKQEGTGTNTEAEIPVSSVNSDTTEGIAVWSAGTKFHTFEGGWGAATGTIWRSYVIVDKDGKLCYACHMPANGYGGPKATSYNRHSDYANWEDNPCITILEGFGPWTQADPKPSQKFELTVPEGGFGISYCGDVSGTIAQVLTGGAVNTADDTTIAQINKPYACVDKLRIKYNKTDSLVTFESIESEVGKVGEAKLNAADIDLPAIYNSSFAGTVKLADYTIGLDSTGKIIFASCTAEGYGGPADGFYHDGTYAWEAGKVCGIFNIASDFQPWAPGLEGAPWTRYTAKVPEGGYIITGTATKMETVMKVLFDVDFATFSETNVYFEKTLVDGELNDVVVNVTPKTGDTTVMQISKK